MATDYKHLWEQYDSLNKLKNEAYSKYRYYKKQPGSEAVAEEFIDVVGACNDELCRILFSISNRLSTIITEKHE